MKKVLTIMLGVLFVLSFAASAFAIHAEIPEGFTAATASGTTNITLGGEIRFRGFYRGNFGSETVYTDFGDFKQFYLPSEKAATSFYDGRVRLIMDAKVSANVEGFIMLETFGQNGASCDSEGYDCSFGSSYVDDKYVWGNFNHHPAGIELAEAWILYTGSDLLGIPAGLKVGHMPLALGNKQFFDHTQLGDDAIVFFMDPNKQLHIGLLTIKFDGEGNNTNNRFSTLALQNKFGTTLLTNGDKSNNGADLDGYVALFTYKLDDKNKIGANWTYVHSGNNAGTGTAEPGNVITKLNLHNIGVHGDGNVAGLGWKAEADFQFGKYNTIEISGVGDSGKFKGYGLYGALNYMVNPINLRASAAYGSGPKEDEGLDMNEFLTFMGTTATGGIKNYTLLYEYYIGSTYYGFQSTGITNTTYYNLGLDFSPTKDIKTSVDGYLIRASKSLFSGQSKNAGSEVDANITYSISKNLKYSIDAGFFAPGAFYQDMYDNLYDNQATSTHLDKKTATMVVNTLTLNF